ARPACRDENCVAGVESVVAFADRRRCRALEHDEKDVTVVVRVYGHRMPGRPEEKGRVQILARDAPDRAAPVRLQQPDDRRVAVVIFQGARPVAPPSWHGNRVAVRSTAKRRTIAFVAGPKSGCNRLVRRSRVRNFRRPPRIEPDASDVELAALVANVPGAIYRCALDSRSGAGAGLERGADAPGNPVSDGKGRDVRVR